MIGQQQTVQTDFVLFSGKSEINILNLVTVFESFVVCVDRNGTSFERSRETSYLLDLSRSLHRTQNYLVSSHVLL